MARAIDSPRTEPPMIQNITLRRVFQGVALATLVTGGCAPVDDPSESATGPTATPIPDTPITEAEQAAGVGERGWDYAEPNDQTDGNVANLAPAFTSGGGTYADGTSTVIEASTACRPAQGYSGGNPRQICVVTVDGKLVEVNTARAYTSMKAAAAQAGVYLQVVSGFRTMDQQRYLYNLYLSGRGNLAARPGYSNHQSGLALDLNASARGVGSWLSNNASRWGFRRTVPSENWHYERPAGSQAGVSGGGAGGSSTDDRCFSQTLGRNMAEGVCLQSRFDNNWYQCSNGAWYPGRGNRGNCSASYPLGSSAGGGETPAGGCHSSTLNRNVGVGTCLQSRFDNQWYQCGSVGWIQSDAIPSSRRGAAGACTQYLPR